MYKYLLVPATGSATDETVFETALLAARPFSAHLEFLHVRVDVTEVVISMSTGGFGGGVAMRGMVDKLDAEARQVEARARQEVGRFCERHGIPRGTPHPGEGLSAEFTVETGSDAQWISEYGRFADLVVVGHAQPGREVAMEVLEAALMDTGRPLLIAPRKVPQTLPGTVVIAWKDTPEAARAVAAALPLIERAERVVIVTVVEGDESREHSSDRLLRTLRWHNANTCVRQLGREGRRPVEVLLAEAGQLQASLIVMGGYSHSRLREVVFGGFTRHILSGIDVPVLMAH
ncbi:Universal stress protein [Rhodovastum atsumiense]|uniref:Universal stress protein n=1 Tax=Rhodovastum atsumiense TaxID=504468 RepID=A0A5M6IN84_9PROT|nr:universal stress protein [Rhodovastum atsumiense]KAA5609714.1 universal stress protein [Rhodovastum atsumiense]CAH2604483.1 Universal stress protein [Rhodovastum atsumiense]